MAAPEIDVGAAGLSRAEKRRIVRLARKDGLFHLKRVQGIEMVEAYQERLVRAVWEKERTAVRSCHCLGKTWTMARIILAIGSAFPGCKIVTTAPTARQVELLLWAEIREGHAKSKYSLGGKILTKKWEFGPDWWSIGFTTQKQASKGEGQTNSGFQGVHSPVLVFVVFDEATGIAADIWKQLEGLMTSAHVKFVAIGNPTTKASPFYACFSDPAYFKVHLSCFDSPNLPANGISNLEDLEREYDYLRTLPEEEQLKRLESYAIPRPHLITARWVMTMALKLGLTHPLFVSKCLGDFPEEDDSALMPLGVTEKAQRRLDLFLQKKLADKVVYGDGRLYIGVDVARKGGDKTVITRLKGPVHLATKVLVKRVTTEVTGAVIAMVNDLPLAERLRGGKIVVDATGIGSGVVDSLREYQAGNLEWRNIEIVEFVCGETWKEGRDGTAEHCAERAKKYVNKKAEAFVLLSESLKADLCLLPEDVYLEELPTIVFQYDSKGRYRIEDKDAYKKRTGRGSPDHADSLCLANYGRYHTGGVGSFTESMAKRGRRPMAASLGE